MKYANPYISAKNNSLAAVFSRVEELLYGEVGENLALGEHISTFIHSLSVDGDTVYRAVLSILHVSEDEYISDCLKAEAPLYFREAIERTKKRGDSGREYMDGLLCTPAIEVFSQAGKTHVCSVVSSIVVSDATDIRRYVESLLAELYSLSDMSDYDCEDAMSFIGCSLQAIPEATLYIECGDYRWVVDKSLKVIGVAAMEPDFFAEEAMSGGDTSMVREVRVINSLFCCPADLAEKDVMAICDAIRTAGFTVEEYPQDTRELFNVSTAA